MTSKEPKPKIQEKSVEKTGETAREVLDYLNSMILLPKIFGDPVGQAFIRLLRWLAKDGGEEKGYKRYGRLWREVMEAQEFVLHPIGNHLQDFWLETFLEDPNPFHWKSEQQTYAQMNNSLKKAYQRELGLFRRILRVDWEREALGKMDIPKGWELPSWKEKNENPVMDLPFQTGRREFLKEKILSDALTDSQLAQEIARHFHENGWGFFGRSQAFRWTVSLEGQGFLEPIEEVDPIRLENLVGYDDVRQPFIDNIESFVSGKPANNVLLYGERGTGKSSTVKAALNEYGNRGLRLIEVHPDDLRDYPEILKAIRSRREKFILFVDDLSFEETETSYKGLKALLEGTVEATPANIILIATSNRRHLVREFFSDREEGYREEGEVHGQDTVEEKLSLSDRFGLVVSFYTPSQDTYLQMVENWAHAEGLKIPPIELRAQALQWALANNGRSGRTARQFINHMAGIYGR